MKVKFWHFVFPLFVVSGLILIGGLCSRHTSTQTVERQPLMEPLARYDASPSILTGTVFKIDNSNTDLSAGGMEMVEIKLDEGQNVMIHFAARPAPVGMFKIGDKVTMKSIYFRVSEVEPAEFSRILIKH